MYSLISTFIPFVASVLRAFFHLLGISVLEKTRSTAPKVFRYPPLDLRKESIRLVRFLPCLKNGAVRCTMSVTQLDSKYIALSYVWGTEEPSHTIEINGSPFYVRDNLYHFLLRAEELHGSRNFWIDAICLDQSNLQERNHQVHQMGKIYGAAQMVICWLGCDDPPDQNGISHFKPKTGTRPRSLSGNTGAKRLSRTELFHALMAICRLYYWQRLWVVPEILSARDLQLVHGEYVIAWPDIVALDAQFCRDSWIKRTGIYLVYQTKFPMASFIKQRNSYQSPHSRSLRQLLNSYGFNHCSDHRDRIFALLALASDRDRWKIDYSETKQDLFVHVLQGHNLHDVEMLQFACHLVKVLDLETDEPAGELGDTSLRHIDFPLLLRDGSQAFASRRLRMLQKLLAALPGSGQASTDKEPDQKDSAPLNVSLHRIFGTPAFLVSCPIPFCNRSNEKQNKRELIIGRVMVRNGNVALLPMRHDCTIRFRRPRQPNGPDYSTWLLEPASPAALIDFLSLFEYLELPTATLTGYEKATDCCPLGLNACPVAAGFVQHPKWLKLLGEHSSDWEPRDVLWRGLLQNPHALIAPRKGSVCRGASDEASTIHIPYRDDRMNADREKPRSLPAAHQSTVSNTNFCTRRRPWKRLS